MPCRTTIIKAEMAILEGSELMSYWQKALETFSKPRTRDALHLPSFPNLLPVEAARPTTASIERKIAAIT